MPNNYFQFKQFTIYQDKCAMKVCTDACLFGAFVSALLPIAGPAFNILDIGAGTGLLSLTLAQKTNAFIDAVEIDEAAAMQAQQNFQASAWNLRLSLHNCSIQLFSQSAGKRYDLIISNPPFFENDLKSNNSKRNLALHSEALTLEALFHIAKEMLAEDALFAVLLPYSRTDYAERLAKKSGLYAYNKTFVKQTPLHAYFRSMLLFMNKQCNTVNNEIIIQNEKHVYSKEFTDLMKDYYLKL